MFISADGRADGESVNALEIVFAIPVATKDILTSLSRDPQRAKRAKDKLDDDALMAGGYVLAALGLAAAQRLFAHSGNVLLISQVDALARRSVVTPTGPRLVIISFAPSDRLGRMGRAGAYLRAWWSRRMGQPVTVVEVKDREGFIQLLEAESALGNRYANIEVNLHGKPGTLIFSDGSSLPLTELRDLPKGSLEVLREGGSWRLLGCTIGAACRIEGGRWVDSGAASLADLLSATAQRGGSAQAPGRYLTSTLPDLLPWPRWITDAGLHLTGLWLPIRFMDLMATTLPGISARSPNIDTRTALRTVSFDPRNNGCPWSFFTRP